jgi:glutathione S-transferase
MIKLYGNPASTCTRKVLFALNETNTPYELSVIDFMKGEHKAPAYVASHQPFGQMPALDDGDFHMFESRAMMRYIDDKAGHKLTPKDAQGRALMEQWISVEMSNFTPHAMQFVYAGAFKRDVPADKLAEAGTKLELACSVMDKRLAETKAFLAGSELTLADLGFAPYIEYAMMHPDAKTIFSKHPHVMAWWNRVSERPTWHKAVGRA